MKGQGPSIHLGDPGDAIPLQIALKAFVRSPIGRRPGRLAHHKARDAGERGLQILPIQPVVPDHRVGHRHQLPRVGRIGEDFLIAGHAGVENHLAKGGTGGAESDAVEAAAVLKEEVGGIGQCGLAAWVGVWLQRR